MRCASCTCVPDRERGEQDRHGALQPAPDRRTALADGAGAPERAERRAHERPRDEREERREREALAPSGRRRARTRCDRQPERDEDDDLGERREPVAGTRSISALNGAPRRRRRIRPATKTARNPEPCGDGRDAVEDAGAGERAQRVQPGDRQSSRAQQPRRDAARRRRRRRARSPSARRTRARRSRSSRPRASRARSSRSSARSRPGRSRPTRPRGSCPVRPPISRSPSTENITAGSVGATAAPSRPAVEPAEAEGEVREQRDDAAPSRTCPSRPSERDRRRPRRGSGAADRGAAVEEDDDERDGRDPSTASIEGRQAREDVRRDGGGDEQDCGVRDRQFRHSFRRGPTG